MKTKKSKTASPSSTPVKGIATIDFGIEPAKPGKHKASKYPVLSGPKIAGLVDKACDLKVRFDAIDGPYKRIKEEIKTLAFPEYLKANHGRVDAPSSMIGYGTEDTREAMVTIKNRFTPGDPRELEKLLGELAPVYFRQHWIIAIDSDKIPAEKGPELITELKKLLTVLGLSHALTIKHGIVPVPDFSAKRHLLDPDLNLKIHEIVPQQMSVLPKGK